MPADDAPITVLLQRLAEGNAAAAESLLLKVHEDLRNIAASQMMGQSADHTLQITALVNEAVVRLMRSHGQWHSRKHFFASAACIMRHVLVNHARRRVRHRAYVNDAAARADKLVDSYEARAGDLQRLDEALRSLATFDPDGALLVDLRFFLDMSMENAAKTLGLAQRTAERKWQNARDWLFQEMSRDA